MLWKLAWIVMSSSPRLGGLEKVILSKNEKVQHVSCHGKHMTYYNPSTKKVNYRYLGKHGVGDSIQDVFQKNCPTVSDLDIGSHNHQVYIAMAHYSITDNDHSIDMAVIDPKTMRVHRYPYPISVAHPTFIRKCSFVHYHGHFSLVSWSIDGTRSVHRVGTPRWMIHSYPFKVYHVAVSENTVGILDNDFVFHVFHPDGIYRNMTVDNDDIHLPVSACHFSVPAKQLILGFPDGTVRVYRTQTYFSQQFHKAVRHVYGDMDSFLLFLDNGDVVMGDMKETLPEVIRWKHVFHPQEMRRYAYQPPYLVVDGDQEGLVLRGWTRLPSEKDLLERIRAATAARTAAAASSTSTTPNRADLDDFLRMAVQKYRNHTASDNNTTQITP